jgi:hypothetical protein
MRRGIAATEVVGTAVPGLGTAAAAASSIVVAAMHCDGWAATACCVLRCGAWLRVDQAAAAML